MYPQQLGDVRGRDAIGHQEQGLGALEDATLDLVGAHRGLDVLPLLGGQRERHGRPTRMRSVGPGSGIDHVFFDAAGREMWRDFWRTELGGWCFSLTRRPAF